MTIGRSLYTWFCIGLLPVHFRLLKMHEWKMTDRITELGKRWDRKKSLSYRFSIPLSGPSSVSSLVFSTVPLVKPLVKEPAPRAPLLYWPRRQCGRLRQARSHAAPSRRRRQPLKLWWRPSPAVGVPRRRCPCERPCAAASGRTSCTCRARRTSPPTRTDSLRRRTRSSATSRGPEHAAA